MNWFLSNGIKINKAKTKLVCFCRPLQDSWMNLPVSLRGSSRCTCSSIKYVDSGKYLGIYFGCNMTWINHLPYTVKRLRSVSCLFCDTNYLLPFSVRKIIVNALTYGVLRNGITAFGNWKTQRKAQRDVLTKAIWNITHLNYHRLVIGDSLQSQIIRTACYRRLCNKPIFGDSHLSTQGVPHYLEED